jgi:hypothetical protein
MVIGLVLVPLTRTTKSCSPGVPVKVPQRWTVVPGPIWLEALPQLVELASQLRDLAVEQPVPLPVLA